MAGVHIFTLLGVPVAVSPWFLVLVGFGFVGGGVADGLRFAAAIFLSILVHEFGHAMVARRYRLEPSVLLHGFGGLTAHAPAEWDHQEALIVAAGPAAGIVLGVVSGLVMWFSPVPLPAVASDMLGTLLYLNLFWSAYNLLPMWPMDGGQLFRIGLHRVLEPKLASRIVHVVGMALVIPIGLLASSLGLGPMMGILLFMTAWQNWTALQAGGAGATRRESEETKSRLVEATRAFESGEDKEAVRLAHQLRLGARLTPSSAAKMWAILGVATTRLGDFEEALSYLKRAPERADVTEAFAQCHFQLRDWEALDALMATPAFRNLDAAKREVIEAAVRASRDPASRFQG
jgi:stage IV sporulation protein FB